MRDGFLTGVSRRRWDGADCGCGIYAVAAVYRVPVLDERPEVPNVGEVFVTFAGQMGPVPAGAREDDAADRGVRVPVRHDGKSGRSLSVRSRGSRSATCPSQSHELVLHVVSLRCSSYASTR